MSKILIEHDLFDIANRLKEIDSGYFVLYDTESLRYELHNKRCNPSLQLIFPYKKLDARAVNHTLYTRIERKDRLLVEMDKNNDKLEKENEEKIKQNALNTADRLFSKNVF